CRVAPSWCPALRSRGRSPGFALKRACPRRSSANRPSTILDCSMNSSAAGSFAPPLRPRRSPRSWRGSLPTKPI
ncbi:MAG: hypothetical protein AVDCRST_MAG39-820, partial [uncultured Sphingomonadaceae bacterium]